MQTFRDFFWSKIFTLLALLGGVAYWGHRQFLFEESFSLALENRSNESAAVWLSTYDANKGNLSLHDLHFAIGPGEVGKQEITLEFSFPAPCEGFVVKQKNRELRFPCGQRTETGFHRAHTMARIQLPKIP